MMKHKHIYIVLIFLGCGLAASAPAGVCNWGDVETWGGCILWAVLDLIFGTFLDLYYSGMAMIILMNPDLTVMNPTFQAYMALLQPFFMFSLVLTAFYLLFVSGSPAGRARAKNMFWKLILTMILVSISPEIFQILMDIAYALSQKVLGSAANKIELGPILATTLVLQLWPVLIIFAIIAVLALVTVGIRWIGVMILAALFPLTLFFYLFEPPFFSGFTKAASQKLTRYTLGFIFAQPLQALMLAIAFIGFSGVPEANPAAHILTFFIGIGGLIMVLLAPLMMMNILSWIGAGIMAAGMGLSLTPGGSIVGGALLTSAGGMMMGMGPGSLFAAGGTASMAYAQRQGRRKTRVP